MWTPSESSEIQTIARETIPGIKTMAIPQGLQVEKGPDAIVEFLIEKVPELMNLPKTEFRQYLPDLSIPRFQIAKDQDPYEYTEAFQKNHAPPWLYNLTKAWEHLLEKQYHGVTNDGSFISCGP